MSQHASVRAPSALRRSLAVGLAAILAAAPLAAQSLPGDITYSMAGFAVPDNRTAFGAVTIGNTTARLLDAGDNVTVRITGLSKPNGSINDLFATLSFIPADGGDAVTAWVFGLPTAGVSRLMPGSALTFSFNSGFTGAFAGTPLASGDVRPTMGSPVNGCGTLPTPQASNLSRAFNGRRIAGQWILTLGDCLSDGGVSIGGWQLGFVTQAPVNVVPEPSAPLLLAGGLAGLVALARRRRTETWQ